MNERPELMKPKHEKSTERIVVEHGFVMRSYFQNPTQGPQGLNSSGYNCPFCYRSTQIHHLTIEKGYSKKCQHCGAKLNRFGGRIGFDVWTQLPKNKKPQANPGFFEP